MYKLSVVLVLAFLIFSLFVSNASARPLQGTSPDTSLNYRVTKLQKEVHGDEVVLPAENPCEGVSADECLMRRSLAAHLDYIYTQKNNKP